MRRRSLLADRIVRTGAAARGVDVGRMNGRFFANGAGSRPGCEGDAYCALLSVADRRPRLSASRSLRSDGRRHCYAPHAHYGGWQRSWDGPITLANVANGPWIGGMFNIAPGARNNDDGIFDLLIVGSRLQTQILVASAEADLGHAHAGESHRARTRNPAWSSNAANRWHSHLDGEVQPLQERFEIELLAGALQLL